MQACCRGSNQSHATVDILPWPFSIIVVHSHPGSAIMDSTHTFATVVFLRQREVLPLIMFASGRLAEDMDV